MASFNFDLPAISAGTTFIFGSWVYMANGSGSFDNHLEDTMSTEVPQIEQLNRITPVEFLLPELADEIEKLSLSNTSPTRLAPLGVDSIYSESP